MTDTWDVRPIIRKIVESDVPPIEIKEVQYEGALIGKVTFSVSIANLNLSHVDLQQHKRQVFCTFFANFLGELLVREHIDKFLQLLTELKSDDYLEIVNSKKHRRFGLEFSSGCLILSFHMSFLQDILTDDLKKIKVEDDPDSTQPHRPHEGHA